MNRKAQCFTSDYLENKTSVEYFIHIDQLGDPKLRIYISVGKILLKIIELRF